MQFLCLGQHTQYRKFQIHFGDLMFIRQHVRKLFATLFIIEKQLIGFEEHITGFNLDAQFILQVLHRIHLEFLAVKIHIQQRVLFVLRPLMLKIDEHVLFGMHMFHQILRFKIMLVITTQHQHMLQLVFLQFIRK